MAPADISACVKAEGYTTTETLQLKHLKADPVEAQRHAKPLVCPECRSNLVPRMHELVPIDVCGQCRAVWLDGDEILQMARRSSAKEKRARARKEYTENYAGAYNDREAAMLHTGDIVDPVQSISEILEWIFSSR